MQLKALFVSKIVKHVHIVHRNERFRADESLLMNLKQCQTLLHLNYIPVEILGDTKGVTSVAIKNVIDGTDKV